MYGLVKFPVPFSCGGTGTKEPILQYSATYQFLCPGLFKFYLYYLLFIKINNQFTDLLPVYEVKNVYIDERYDRIDRVEFRCIVPRRNIGPNEASWCNHIIVATEEGCMHF